MSGMLRSKLLATSFLLIFDTFQAKAQEATLNFEAASVKPWQASESQNPQMGRSAGGPGSKSPGQFTAIGMSLKSLLFNYAYGFYRYQYAAPAWMEKELYDVVAKVPPGTTREQFQVMIQNLLIERFKIALHHEQREMIGYDLVVAKGGPRMKTSAADEKSKEPPVKWSADGFPIVPDGAAPFSMQAMVKGQSVLSTNRYTTDHLADTLSGWLGAPVSDKTGLKGNYAFLLHYELTNAPAASGTAASASDSPGATAVDVDVEPAPGLLSAVQSQLGLKLEKRKTAVDVLVIDSAEKVPIEN